MKTETGTSAEGEIQYRDGFVFAERDAHEPRLQRSKKMQIPPGALPQARIEMRLSAQDLPPALGEKSEIGMGKPTDVRKHG
jgi:hypothetical protein